MWHFSLDKSTKESLTLRYVYSRVDPIFGLCTQWHGQWSTSCLVWPRAAYVRIYVGFVTGERICLYMQTCGTC
jgi:hypothetical protein